MISNYESTMTRFGVLKSKVGKNLRGMYDVYIVNNFKGLLYYPIISLKFQEVLAERERLANLDAHELVCVKIVYEELLGKDPYNPRSFGCFRKTEWLTPNFSPTTLPIEMKKMKKHLEKESKWLSGGPRPNKNYVK